MRKFKKRFVGFLGALAAVPMVLSGMVSVPARGATPASPTWDFAADFKASPNQANPTGDSYGNTDVWAYLRGTPQAVASYASQTFQTGCASGGVDDWAGPGGLPSIAKNTGSATNCAGIPVAAGQAFVHPQFGDTAAIIRWKSPVTGSVTVTGGVAKLDLGGDGVDWSVDKGNAVLASGSIPGNGSQLFSAGSGGGGLSNVSVNAGDSLYLVVDSGAAGNASNDLTGVTFTISLNYPPSTTTPAGADWNLATDFKSRENPVGDSYDNPWVWTYLRGTPQSSSGYNLLSTYNGSECVSREVSSFSNNSDVPYVAKNRASSPTTCATNNFPGHSIVVHPSNTEAAIMRFRVPVSGKIAITGGLTDTDSGGGDGIAWSIDKGDTLIASGGFNNGGSQLFSAGTGGTSLASITVAAGDLINLAVAPKNGFDYDSTLVDYTLTLIEGGIATTTTTEAPTTTTEPPTTTTSTTIATPPPLDPMCANPTMTVPAKFRGTFKGTPGNDVILGRLGVNDNIDAGDGDDIICSLTGKDLVRGGNGHDQIYGQNGPKTGFKFYGGAGNDVLSPRGGESNGLYGDDGDDVLYGTGAKKEVLQGGKGNDAMSGGYGSDNMTGGEGDDTMSGDFGNDVMNGGDGNDDINGGGDVDNINGGRGVDRCSPNLGRYDKVKGCESPLP